MPSSRPPRKIFSDFCTRAGTVLKRNRSAHLDRAVQHALLHLIADSYGATNCVIYNSEGRDKFTIKRTISGWVVSKV